MTEKTDHILLHIEKAIDQGEPPTVETLRRLRNQADKGANLGKVCLWGGIVGLNLLIWVPLPMAIPKILFFALCGICLAIAILVPIVVMKKYRLAQEWLKAASDRPKKRQTSEKGKVYIDAVKKEGRDFVKAEVELLEKYGIKGH